MAQMWTSVIKREPWFVGCKLWSWSIQYILWVWLEKVKSGLWRKKKIQNISLSSKQPVETTTSLMPHLPQIQTESPCRRHIAATLCDLLLPRLGVLVVFLPPRILKKPFPKDERAFLEPKLSSSVVAGKVAEGLIGGFSIILRVSSLLF